MRCLLQKRFIVELCGGCGDVWEEVGAIARFVVLLAGSGDFAVTGGGDDDGDDDAGSIWQRCGDGK